MFISCYAQSLGLLGIPRWCHIELLFVPGVLGCCIRHAQSAFPSPSLAVTTRQQKTSCYIWHYMYSIHQNSVLRYRNVVLALIIFHELLQNSES